MKTEYIAIIVMIIIAAMLLYYGYNTFLKNRDLKSETNKSSIDVLRLIEALGGKDNIKDITFSPSKLTVVLNDQSLINVNVIKEVGASGIVQGSQQLSMIFGRQSALIAEDIKNKI